MVDHLNNFRRDIDRYVHAMPGVLLGVSCADVIQVAMSLQWYIDNLKGALIEAMLAEGLSPVRDSDAISGPLRLHPSPVTSTPIRGQFHQQHPARVQGHFPPLMEDYLSAIALEDQSNRTDTTRPDATYVISSNPMYPNTLSPISSPVYQNTLSPIVSTAPSRPPRSVDSLTISTSSTMSNTAFATALSSLRISERQREVRAIEDNSRNENSPSSNTTQATQSGNSSSLARPFM